MNTEKRYFGMTFAQISILAVLAIFACIIIGILGVLISNFTPNKQPAQQAYTLVPSQTPDVTTTPWPTITPIPDWLVHSFAAGQAQIWLPSSYFGGDTSISSEEIIEELRATVDDEAFINEIQGLISIPEITFFAFDADFVDSTRFMHIGSEPLNPDLPLTMNDYLNRMMDNFTDGNDRVVERQVVQLDYYPAGKLVVESKVPAGDLETFVSMAIYMVKVDNTMWFITFRTGRQEYKDYQPIIEAAVNSFWIQH